MIELWHLILEHGIKKNKNTHIDNIPYSQDLNDALHKFVGLSKLHWTNILQPFAHKIHVLHPILALRQYNICQMAENGIA